MTGRLAIGEKNFIGARVEYFEDKDQVLVITGTTNGFQTFGASLNLDWEPEPGILFRNELRTLTSKDAVFVGKNGGSSSNTLAVTSLSLSF